MSVDKQSGKMSGGENQSPYFVAILASYLHAYNRHESRRKEPSLALVPIDEAFSKLSGERIQNCLQAMAELDLQGMFSMSSGNIPYAFSQCDELIVITRKEERAAPGSASATCPSSSSATRRKAASGSKNGNRLPPNPIDRKSRPCHGFSKPSPGSIKIPPRAAAVRPGISPSTTRNSSVSPMPMTATNGKSPNAICVAESQSRGLFQIDRQPRSGSAIRLRLARDGGEEWLFQQIGDTSPEESRRKLAEYFIQSEARPVPAKWRHAWSSWFSKLAELSLRGESVQPFRRDDHDGNHALTDAIAGILDWQGPSLVRYASSAICGDSKQLQILEPRLRVALEAITGSSSLEDFGIHRKPRAITFHGPLSPRHRFHRLRLRAIPRARHPIRNQFH